MSSLIPLPAQPWRRLRARLAWPLPVPRVLPDAVPFQGDLEEIIAAPAPRFLRFANLLVAALLATMLLLAALLEVDSIVAGTGQLAVDRPVILLQPMEQSIVRELKVKAGDSVRKGQVLATFDPTFSEADLAALKGQRRDLTATIRRLEAELGGTALPVPGPRDAVALAQLTLYREHQAQLEAQLRAFDETLRGNEADIRTGQSDIAMLTRQLELARDVEAMYAKLYKMQTGSRLQYLQAQAATARARREHQEAVNRLTQLRHEGEAKRAQRQAFVEEWNAGLRETLVKSRSELDKVDQQLAKASRLRALAVLTAPEDGTVLNVAVRAPGSVLRGAEPLVSILPSQAAMIAEVRVSSRDIGYVRPGDEVVIKIDAFPYQRHGLLEGRLRSVSQESATANGGEGGGERFHRLQIELTRTALKNLPEQAHLIPGMTLAAEIKVGRHSILGYFLYPILRGFDESIREA